MATPNPGAAGTPTNPTPPGTIGSGTPPAPGVAPSPVGPPPSRRKTWTVVVAAAVAVIVVVAVLALAGVFSPGSSGSGSTGTPAPFSSAVPAAISAAQAAPGGPWTVVAAEGVAVASEVPATNESTIGGGGCTYTPVSGEPSQVSIPATPHGATAGEVSVWVFFAKNASSNSLLFLSVLNGQATALGVVSGCAAVTDFVGLGAISASGVLDSTTVASDFNQNGGGAFLENNSWQVQLFILIGPSADTGGAAVWDIMYSTCGLTSIGGAGAWISGFYYASSGSAVTPPAPGSGTCG